MGFYRRSIFFKTCLKICIGGASISNEELPCDFTRAGPSSKCVKSVHVYRAYILYIVLRNSWSIFC